MGEDDRISFTLVTAVSCSGPHSKITSDFNRHQSGDVILDIFGMYAARKFIISNRRLILALSVGEVISIMALTLDGSGLVSSGVTVVPSGVTMVPRYLTSFTRSCSLCR